MFKSGVSDCFGLDLINNHKYKVLNGLIYLNTIFVKHLVDIIFVFLLVYIFLCISNS